MITYLGRTDVDYNVKSVTLTGFDNTYKDLIIKGRFSTTYNTNDRLYVFNGLNVSQYTDGFHVENGIYNNTNTRTGYADLYGASYPGLRTDIELRFPNFATSGVRKVMQGTMFPWAYNTQQPKNASFGTISASTGAITSVKLELASGNFGSETYFDVYLIGE